MKRRKDYGTTSPRNHALRAIPIKVSGVYRITNRLDGKIYIGSATDIRRRLRVHLIDLRKGDHINPHLQRAFVRDGEVAFAFDVLELCEKVNRLAREQYHFDVLTPHNDKIGYNISLRADSGPSIVFTPEMRAVISKRFKGKPKSEEHRRKIGDAQKWRTHTVEQRKSHSEKIKRFYADPANCAAQSQRQAGVTRRGTPCKEEIRRLLSEARLGVLRPALRKYSAELIEEWIQKKRSGMSYSVIARAAGVCQVVLARVVRRHLLEKASGPVAAGDGFRKYGDEHYKQWLEMRNRGMSLLEISVQSGVHTGTISKVLKRFREEKSRKAA